MAKREEEAHTDRFSAALQQLPSRVVDCRDVVGIERVPETKGIGEPAKSQKAGMRSSVSEKEAPPEEMRNPHGAEEPSEPAPLARIERLGEQDPHRGHAESLSLIATRSQVGIQIRGWMVRTVRTEYGPVGFAAMDLDELPPQVRFVLRSLDQAMKSREPAIRSKVDQLRAARPTYTNDQLALSLIRSTRRRVAATGAISGAASIAPGLGTALAIGAVTSQTLYALEQEIELVLGIAMIFGHELSGSEGRVLEALVVVGVTSGSLKLREDVLVAGGERLAVAAFRRVPNLLLVHGSGRFVTRILARLATTGTAKMAARIIPLGVGIGVGAGFDLLPGTGVGGGAIRDY